MIDYSIFYKRSLDDGEWDKLPEYDLFISTYECSDRVIENFNQIKAKEKHWLLTPHYKIPSDKLPTSGKSIYYELFNEDDYIVQYFSDLESTIGLKNINKICVDITGFIRPFIIYLFRYLQVQGFKEIDVIYGEPKRYIKADETEFSGFVDSVKPVPSCSAIDLLPPTENDVLITAVGYDDKLIAAVAGEKRHCALKYHIYGFPSLQPDMYQEGVLRVNKVKESFGDEVIDLFAPAFDPFITAQKLQETIESFLLKTTANFYLSPLSTKPQVLGFALYYICEGVNKPVNIIFPYSNHYSINTCKGRNKVWMYKVELP